MHSTGKHNNFTVTVSVVNSTEQKKSKPTCINISQFNNYTYVQLMNKLMSNEYVLFRKSHLCATVTIRLSVFSQLGLLQDISCDSGTEQHK